MLDESLRSHKEFKKEDLRSKISNCGVSKKIRVIGGIRAQVVLLCRAGARRSQLRSITTANPFVRSVLFVVELLRSNH